MTTQLQLINIIIITIIVVVVVVVVVVAVAVVVVVVVVISIKKICCTENSLWHILYILLIAIPFILNICNMLNIEQNIKADNLWLQNAVYLQ